MDLGARSPFRVGCPWRAKARWLRPDQSPTDREGLSRTPLSTLGSGSTTPRKAGTIASKTLTSSSIGRVDRAPDAEFPQPGNELAGFRVIFELGRGAFARVYLAEEISLGQRLVAIKVSRPMEMSHKPWRGCSTLTLCLCIPSTTIRSAGFASLCMPYFGGANLAQVLEAAGGFLTAQHAGRSLVEALDQISRSLPALPVE